MDTSKTAVARIRFSGEEYLLYPGQQFRMGRSNENDLILQDPKISRNHALIEWIGNAFTIRDLGSVNGTFVNNERITSAQLLRDNDEIAVSQNVMSYEIIRAAPGEPIAQAMAGGETEPLNFKGAYLVVAQGLDRGQEYPLWGECVTIGRASRDATWEIRLTDRAVSRPHARLERRTNGFYLVDLESVNGTLLNTSRVRDAYLLKDGDVITVGGTQLVFHDR